MCWAFVFFWETLKLSLRDFNFHRAEGGTRRIKNIIKNVEFLFPKLKFVVQKRPKKSILMQTLIYYFFHPEISKLSEKIRIFWELKPFCGIRLAVWVASLVAAQTSILGHDIPGVKRTAISSRVFFRFIILRLCWKFEFDFFHSSRIIAKFLLFYVAPPCEVIFLAVETQDDLIPIYPRLGANLRSRPQILYLVSG